MPIGIGCRGEMRCRCSQPDFYGSLKRLAACVVTRLMPHHDADCTQLAVNFLRLHADWALVQIGH
jgi:hypothetical protein